jgi:hypothetical protein
MVHGTAVESKVVGDRNALGAMLAADAGNRLSWGALLLPGLWSLAHGAWGWFGIIAGLSALWQLAFGLMNRAAPSQSVFLVPAVVVTQVVSWSVAAALATRASDYVRVSVASDALTLPSDSSRASAAPSPPSERVWALAGGVWLLGANAVELARALDAGLPSRVNMALASVGVAAIAVALAAATRRYGGLRRDSSGTQDN